MGKLIVIEGLDGSGKSTQTPILEAELKNQGREVLTVSFPNYESDSSALVRMYLSGTFGTRPTDVNAYAASSFYAVDRYASYMTGWKGFYEKSDSVFSPPVTPRPMKSTSWQSWNGTIGTLSSDGRRIMSMKSSESRVRTRFYTSI